ncbi:MAG: alpha/beta fold hydrolase [Balneolaceae bacterium]
MFNEIFLMKTFSLFVVLTSFFGNYTKASECVILVHGLARSEYSFSKLESVLSDSGYVVINNSYPSTKHDIETLAEDFIPLSIKECPTSSDIHFVTHSLGGILVRQYLSTNSVANLGRVLMLAPPNKGSEITDELKDNFWYKLVNGPAGAQLGTDSTSAPNQQGPAHFEVGIIAGTKTVNPILSTMLPNPDDGKVSVESTKLEGMTDHIEMPVSHTFMMRDDDVLEQVIYFLNNGQFNRSE